jgi:hypothetical protein
VHNWALEEGIFAPARKHFPDVEGSNYGNTWWGYVGMCGTHGSEPYYGMGTPHVMAGIWDNIGRLRVTYNHANGHVQPWIARKSWPGDHAAGGPFNPSWYNNRYYDEFVRHILLHEPDPLLLFFNRVKDGDYTALTDVMQEVEEELGGAYSLLTTGADAKGDDGVLSRAESKAAMAEMTTADAEFPTNNKGKLAGRTDVVTGVELKDGTALWRLSGRRFGRSDEDNTFPAESGAIEISVQDEGGSEVDTTTIPGDSMGTWWRYEEATTDLTFAYRYPELGSFNPDVQS